ncbi:Penicillin-binding protein 2B [Lentibacillus sp. JNUCC-1]|uniref:peptidoglycan D,D-transpeptidase FtsI family protein n=1 Tax=Lentibacillus sp. JNUCC-1 TaxID=2654513 RepID=UPI0012E957CB|nr:penicillin-binding protein 2 [Lentibacillus sp. JNUCC-1]MUV39629.1 Penicillin-binding protein 2B [Lentibacillus sp. JNUCC-1]
MANQKKKTKKSQLPFRLNILFFIVFILFSVLIIQLGVVQILNGQEFQDEIDRTIEDTTKIPVPRGKIYDRDHNVIVDNKPMYSITYTPAKGVQAQDRLDVAEELAKYITMLEEDEDAREKQLKAITDRDRREYWYLKHEEEARDRLSQEEAAEMETSDQYQAILDRITDEEISGFSEKQLEVIMIKKELDKAPYLTPHIVKNENVTIEEYARVAEHMNTLPGVNATTDWDREYPYDYTLKSFVGTITSQEEGILADKKDYYMTRGYSSNDRVGRSGLEDQYEEILRGRKEQLLYTTNKDGKVVDSKVVVEGKRGKDLVLTIDMAFQKKVDQIVKEELEAAVRKQPYENRTLDDALAVVLHPKTGELLAVSGQRYDREKGEAVDVGIRTVIDQHLPGSSIKGATVLAGLDSGVITPGQVFVDKPIRIQGDPKPRSSWKDLGPVNDIGALKMSSNVYMFNIAMRMLGDYNHQYGDKIDVSNWDAFQDIRNYFWQFGLGTKTGIDLPYEATGLVGSSKKSGYLLNQAIGQHDTYTTMQLAQYVATIANDGYRVRPHFLKEVREPISQDGELGPIYETVDTDVLNKVEMDDSYIDRVQEGFRRAFQERPGTGYSYWGNKPYKPAGKTGTAENRKYIEKEERVVDTINLALVGYAPYDDPEVAFALNVPNLGDDNESKINHSIGTRIMDAYFDMKEGKLSEDDSSSESDD